MEDYELALPGRVLGHGVVCLQYPLVEAPSLGITSIKLSGTQLRIVQEEPAAKVVDGLLRLGLELVGDKYDVVACLAEHLGEEGLVAPLATIADGIERKHVLEDEARQVPRGYHIRKRHE